MCGLGDLRRETAPRRTRRSHLTVRRGDNREASVDGAGSLDKLLPAGIDDDAVVDAHRDLVFSIVPRGRLGDPVDGGHPPLVPQVLDDANRLFLGRTLGHQELQELVFGHFGHLSSGRISVARTSGDAKNQECRRDDGDRSMDPVVSSHSDIVGAGPSKYQEHVTNRARLFLPVPPLYGLTGFQARRGCGRSPNATP